MTANSKSLFLLFFLLSLLFINSACTLSGHNPGETEAEKLWGKGKYLQALEIIETKAAEGFPWAQMRLGIAYEYGEGKTQNHAEAIAWYRKAAVQTRPNAWSDGQLIGFSGEPGFFAQNSDAKVSQYLIARILFYGSPGVRRNLEQAWLWGNHVNQLTEGNDILYCCEARLRNRQFISHDRITSLLRDIEKELTDTQLQQLNITAVEWKPN